MTEMTAGLVRFLNESPSCFHAAEYVRKALEAEGYHQLCEGAEWTLKAGGKYYVMRNQSALIAFRLPEEAPMGFILTASHSDRPCFKIKENPELETVGAYLRIAVERYGGMLMSTWLDRPLSVAGRVMVETERGFESRLVCIDKDLLLIPNVAIHMNRSANDGFTYNPAVDMIPLYGPLSSKGGFRACVAQAAETEPERILGMDIFLYNRQRAVLWGPEEDYISAQALDDLQCAYATLQGFLQAAPGGNAPVYCLFDNEEVGSGTRQGADSTFLMDTLARLCRGTGADLRTALANSFMVSADNAHAVHPNHPEYADGANRPVINGGVVLKYNANQRYTTDGVSAALFTAACRRANVPVQTYCNRADLPGGSTLGNISSSQVSLATVDVGLPQLAMHSSFETAGTADTAYLADAVRTLYEASVRDLGTGTFDVSFGG